MAMSKPLREGINEFIRLCAGKVGDRDAIEIAYKMGRA